MLFNKSESGYIAVVFLLGLLGFLWLIAGICNVSLTDPFAGLHTALR